MFIRRKLKKKGVEESVDLGVSVEIVCSDALQKKRGVAVTMVVEEAISKICALIFGEH